MKKGKEIRNGNVLKFKNSIFTVLKAEHVKPSEKKCFMRLKMQNLDTGQIINEQVYASDTVEDLRLDEKEMQFLFSSAETYTFMDTTDYEQLEIQESFIGNQIKFLEEEMLVKVKLYEERPISIELPATITAEIDYTENVDKGNTTGNVIKDATLKNGTIIKVPDFVKIGDKIKINTETGEYMSRV